MKTEVVFVIDGSGSMVPKATDVREGFNAYVSELKKQAKEEKDYTLTAVVFNTKVFPLFTQSSLSKVPELTSKNYAPGGNTALYDAIGEGLEEIKTKKNSQYIMVIMTDGEENSSRKFSRAHITEKIKSFENRGNWTFVYLGADQDSFGQSRNIGINAGQTYGGWGALDPLGGMQDLAKATSDSQYQYAATRGADSKSFAANLSSTSTATTSRIDHKVPIDNTYDPTQGASS